MLLSTVDVCAALQASQVPSSQQLLPMDQSSQLLAQAETALDAAAQLSAEPSLSPSEASSGGGGMDRTLLATMSELLQAARAAGIAFNADEERADLQEQLQQVLGVQAAGMQTDAALVTVTSCGAQAAAPSGIRTGVQASPRQVAAAESQGLGPATTSVTAQTPSAGRGQRPSKPQVQQEMSATFSAIWEPVHPNVPTADAAMQGALVTSDAAAQAQGLIAAQVRA